MDVGTPLWRRLLREAVVLLLLWTVYSSGRWVAARHTGSAFQHADQVWRWERALRLPNEASLQAWLLHWPALVRLANEYYAWLHFPATVACLAWLFVRRPQHYLRFRRILAAVTAAALAGHLLYPLAPPRMLPQYGIVDTGVLFGLSVYGPTHGDGLANQFAAMPSLHVGWSIAVALALIVAGAGRRRLLWLAHPVLTVMVVTVTGNHFWLDAVVAAVLVGLALAAFPPEWAARPARAPAELAELPETVEPAQLPDAS